jgi:hypothetical protein
MHNFARQGNTLRGRAREQIIRAADNLIDIGRAAASTAASWFGTERSQTCKWGWRASRRTMGETRRDAHQVHP